MTVGQVFSVATILYNLLHNSSSDWNNEIYGL